MTQGKGKAPKLQVEISDEPSVQPETARATDEVVAEAASSTATAEHANQAGKDTATSTASATSDATSVAAGTKAERVATWFARTFPGREYAVAGGLLGLFAAIMVFVVGVGKTLFVALMVLAGVTLGQCLDGNPRIINAVRRLIDKYRNE